MEAPLISVIVPAYNAKKYLPACVASVQRQEHQNWELLLIDDGSTDESGALCDRCAEPIQKPMSLSLHKILVEDLQNREDADDEYVLVQDSTLDLSDLLREELLLFFPTKMLCKPDCKGLCCKCGKNLNDGPCDCQKDVDPRLESLLQLLD